MKELKTVNSTDESSVESPVAILADEIEQQKHRIAWSFFHGYDHRVVIDPVWCNNWKDARFIAVKAFKLAGYNPDKYDFDVKASTDGGFIVIVTEEE